TVSANETTAAGGDQYGSFGVDAPLFWQLGWTIVPLTRGELPASDRKLDEVLAAARSPEHRERLAREFAGSAVGVVLGTALGEGYLIAARVHAEQVAAMSTGQPGYTGLSFTRRDDHGRFIERVVFGEDNLAGPHGRFVDPATGRL